MAATSTGKLGTCKLTVSGDADMTSGTALVSSEVDVEVVPGATIGFQIGLAPAPPAPAPATPPSA